MPDLILGGGPSDIVVATMSGVARPVGPAVCTLWDAETGGTEYDAPAFRLGSEGRIPPVEVTTPDGVFEVWVQVQGIAGRYRLHVQPGPAGQDGEDGAQGAPGGSDAETAQRIENGPLTKAALGAVVAPFGPFDLSRSQAILASDPTAWRYAEIGDSTRDPGTSSSPGAATYGRDRMRTLHTKTGGMFDGVPAANIQWMGSSGSTIPAWRADTARWEALLAFNPTVLGICFGLNDWRLGQATVAGFRASMLSLVDALRVALPNTDIVIWTPNPMLTKNVGGLNLVRGSDGTINPPGAAQAYTTGMRQALLDLAETRPHVTVGDAMEAVFGTQALESHPRIIDQLHPSPRTAVDGDGANAVPYDGGYVALADYMAQVLSGRRGALVPSSDTQYRREFIVSTVDATVVQLKPASRSALAAPQEPISTADTLYTRTGRAVELTPATILRPHGNDIRISGIGDLSGALIKGDRVVITGTHPGATTGDRQVISVDLPSIPAGEIAATTVAVTGVRTASSGAGMGVVVTPSPGAISAGLQFLSAYPSANDTVTVLMRNPTAAAIDRPAENWMFWVVR